MKSSYSGVEMPKGTGFMYVKKDGTTLYFANQREYRNLQLGRVGKKLKWIRTRKPDGKKGMGVKPVERKDVPKPAEKIEQQKSEKK